MLAEEFLQRPTCYKFEFPKFIADLRKQNEINYQFDTNSFITVIPDFSIKAIT